jgi:AcrR family transcriptional regulator
MPRRPGRTKAGNERRASIIQMAEQIIRSDGFHELTMDSIAEAMDIGKSTLYHYFATKDDLIAVIYSDTMTFLLNRYDERLELASSFSEVLEGAISDMLELNAQSPGKIRTLYAETRRLPVPIQNQMRKVERQYASAIATTITNGIIAGEFRRVDPFLASQALIGIVAHARFWFNPQGERDFRQVARQLWDILQGGLTPAS